MRRAASAGFPRSPAGQSRSARSRGALAVELLQDRPCHALGEGGQLPVPRRPSGEEAMEVGPCEGPEGTPLALDLRARVLGVVVRVGVGGPEPARCVSTPGRRRASRPRASTGTGVCVCVCNAPVEVRIAVVVAQQELLARLRVHARLQRLVDRAEQVLGEVRLPAASLAFTRPSNARNGCILRSATAAGRFGQWERALSREHGRARHSVGLRNLQSGLRANFGAKFCSDPQPKFARCCMAAVLSRIFSFCMLLLQDGRCGMKQRLDALQGLDTALDECCKLAANAESNFTPPSQD